MLKKQLLATLFIIVSTQLIVAQIIDANFNPIIKGISRVTSLTVQPDNKVLIVGDFILVNNTPVRNLARINQDGTYDSTFNTSSLPVGHINYIFYDGSTDKIYLAGGFEDSNDLIRINYDGSIDESFNLNVNLFNVLKIDQQSSGKLIVYSMSTDNNSVIRIDTNGAKDDSFYSSTGPSGSSSDDDLTVLLNDKIAIVGDFTQYDGNDKNKIVLLNEDGTIDDSFNVGAGASAMDYYVLNSINEMPDGGLLVSGRFTSFDGVPTSGIVKLESTGGIDSNFPLPGSAGAVFDNQIISAIDNSGRIVLAGMVLSANKYSMLRLNEDGTLDALFNQGSMPIHKMAGSISQPSIAIASNDEIYIGAIHSKYNNFLQNSLTKIDNNGDPIEAFNIMLGGKATLYTGIALADGKVLIGGEFIGVGNDRINNIALLNSDGTLNSDFHQNIGSGADRTVNVIAKDQSGNFIVGGSFTSFNDDNSRSALVRIGSTGITDVSFNPGVQIKFLGLGINAVKIQQDGKVVIGGLFDFVDNVNINSIARLDVDGSIDNTFNSTNLLPVNAWIRDIDIQSDGKAIVGGQYFASQTNSGGILMRLDLIGDEDLTFNFNYDLAGLEISDIEVLLDDSFLATSANTSTFKFPLLQFNNDGSIKDDLSVTVGDASGIDVIEQVDANNIFIGGQFINVNGVQVDGFAGVGLAGSVDSKYSFKFDKIGNYVAPFVRGIHLIDAETLLLFGGFSSIENSKVYSIAKVNLLAPLAPSDLVASFAFESGVSLNWTDKSNDETEIEIYRSRDNLIFELIGTVEANITNYLDTILDLANNYQYRIKAFNGTFYSGYSNVYDIIIDDIAVPTSLSASFDFIQGVELNWNNNAISADEIKVYKSQDNINFSLLNQLAPNLTTTSDTAVSLSTLYYYKLKVVSGRFKSNYTDTLTFLTPESSFSTVPYNLVANFDLPNSLNLIWEDSSLFEMDYEVFRSIGSGENYEFLTLVDESFYTDTDISFGASHFYKVRSSNNFEISDFSEETSFLVTSIGDNNVNQNYGIFPNPVANSVTVTSQLNTISSYMLTDRLGRTIIEFQNRNAIFKIDLSSYQSGLYYLIIENQNSKVALKVIIDH